MHKVYESKNVLQISERKSTINLLNKSFKTKPQSMSIFLDFDWLMACLDTAIAIAKAKAISQVIAK